MNQLWKAKSLFLYLLLFKFEQNQSLHSKGLSYLGTNSFLRAWSHVTSSMKPFLNHWGRIDILLWTSLWTVHAFIIPYISLYRVIWLQRCLFMTPTPKVLMSDAHNLFICILGTHLKNQLHRRSLANVCWIKGSSCNDIFLAFSIPIKYLLVIKLKKHKIVYSPLLKSFLDTGKQRDEL